MPEPIKPRDILGNAETRKLCGTRDENGRLQPVTRSTLIRWREEFGFPEPIRTLESGELWDRRAVKEWLRTSRPRRGPKPS